ncbi:unnamed protein product [Kuraishia capsulata CBS 1993]|uniref:Golgi apyrase n=1 Tax=Kuraishia capsulata CBS 1993 TaxID=1382522 RepID=W6MI08_9ASCO|nr:uncharacterized protein KUCA_T00001686001 [Kuraishia capsulata CBS 1993]CDK25716.1 unnamed protein product [Kuraishia capsulata CBS 1993]
MPHIAKRKSNKQGPVLDKSGIPYNYIVVIDAGSKGSRAYVYNWLDPESLVSADEDKGPAPRVELLKRIDINAKDGTKDDTDDEDNDNDTKEDDSDEDSEDDEVENQENKPPSKEDTDNNKSEANGIAKGDQKVTKMDVPVITTEKNWRKKIKPGLSAYKDKPKKVGSKHIKYLLDAVSDVVPESQQSRTPVFLHATAGMRLLTPREQEEVLKTTCDYISQKYNFYLPDCASHMNIIDGEVEGLYGWIAMNYLMNTFQDSSATYGLLDMGGASTQISFQPNQEEATEHSSALYNIKLGPGLDYGIFCASFLGYGINQAHNKYIDTLKEQAESTGAGNGGIIHDPCLPKGLIKDDDPQVEGSGDFEQCMKLMYPLLTSTEHSETSSCSTNEPQEVSSCLLSDSIPSFDFNVDRFVGVSGYWDAISHLLKFEDIKSGGAYSYEAFSTETKRVCEMTWTELDKLNNRDNDDTNALSDLTDTDLKQLCFKSSWVLSVLHRGLGFPALGSDTADSDKPLSVTTLVNGYEFTWTLGRAVLYASSEYARAIYGDEFEVGYFKGTSPNVFVNGAEVKGVAARPAFSESKDGSQNNIDTQNEVTGGEADSTEDTWITISDHRMYGSLSFLALLLVVLYLLFGKSKRKTIVDAFKRVFSKKTILDLRPKYKPLRSLEMPRDALELDDMLRAEEATAEFEIDDDSDELSDDGLDIAPR